MGIGSVLRRSPAMRTRSKRQRPGCGPATWYAAAALLAGASVARANMSMPLEDYWQGKRGTGLAAAEAVRAADDRHATVPGVHDRAMYRSDLRADGDRQPVLLGGRHAPALSARHVVRGLPRRYRGLHPEGAAAGIRSRGARWSM